MGKKKKVRLNKVDPNESLKLTALAPDLEETARELYEKACCGSREQWESNSLSNLKESQTSRISFFESAHEGMYAAQEFIVEKVLSNEKLTSSELILYRGISDSIAWQLIGNQLCYARRLYKGHKQPNLHECNFESAIRVATEIRKNTPGSMPLISDLTSFVQVGDILSMSAESKLNIMELKEGSVNQKITDFLHFYSDSKCDLALKLFVKNEKPNVVKQMNRVIRQVSRLEHVKEVMITGQGSDPDTGEKIFIPEEVIYGKTWDKELWELIESANSKGWALDVFDNCLYVACYREDKMRHGGHILFNSWFSLDENSPSDQRLRLFNSMQIPLAPPIFVRQLPYESMFDLLFGRLQICVGIKLIPFLAECKNAGLKVRIGSNKETTQLRQAGIHPILHDKKAIFIANQDNEIALMDGIFFRSLFDGQKPLSVMKNVLSLNPKS